MLDVGEELLGETLPLKMGQRLYQLRGLKASTWYEVKISYPASIPASFSIELRRSTADSLFGKNRRLLNTEKLVFKADIDGVAGGVWSFVLVTVAAAGVVAKPHVQERDTVLFNIVCDELSFGIPLKAWCVGLLAALCLFLAAIVPNFLPLNLLTSNQIDGPTEKASSKES
ncbi:unnamed protein product [Spirodela intermedia]|uniref:Uncharacterized protein n=1 Tax=Spirodela intermedia TaxID=51605 RepID=A0A7I8LFR7_SPIIN|nr:unnamed protein product [Spirodela intermedia]